MQVEVAKDLGGAKKGKDIQVRESLITPSSLAEFRRFFTYLGKMRLPHIPDPNSASRLHYSTPTM